MHASLVWNQLSSSYPTSCIAVGSSWMTPTPSQDPPIPQGGGRLMGYDHDHGRGGGGGTRNLEHIYIHHHWTTCNTCHFLWICCQPALCGAFGPVLPFQAEVKRLAAKETLLEDRAGRTRIFFKDRYAREFHNHFAGSDQSPGKGLHKTGLDLDASSLVVITEVDKSMKMGNVSKGLEIIPSLFCFFWKENAGGRGSLDTSNKLSQFYYLDPFEMSSISSDILSYWSHRILPCQLVCKMEADHQGYSRTIPTRQDIISITFIRHI